MPTFNFPPGKKLTDQELINAFGAEFLVELHKEKILEEKDHLISLETRLQKKMDYVCCRKFSEKGQQAAWLSYLDETLSTKIRTSRKLLNHYLHFYKKAANTLHAQNMEFFREEVNKMPQNLKNYFVQVTECFLFEVKAKNEKEAEKKAEGKWLNGEREKSWKKEIGVKPYGYQFEGAEKYV